MKQDGDHNDDKWPANSDLWLIRIARSARFCERCRARYIGRKSWLAALKDVDKKRLGKKQASSWLARASKTSGQEEQDEWNNEKFKLCAQNMNILYSMARNGSVWSWAQRRALHCGPKIMQMQLLRRLLSFGRKRLASRLKSGAIGSWNR